MKFTALILLTVFCLFFFPSLVVTVLLQPQIHTAPKSNAKRRRRHNADCFSRKGQSGAQNVTEFIFYIDSCKFLKCNVMAHNTYVFYNLFYNVCVVFSTIDFYLRLY